jgi:hypothetical protein
MNRFELGIDLNDGAKKPRRINIRADILAGALLSAVKDHFSLNGEYELRLTGAEGGLLPDAPLNQQGVSDKAVLRCVPVRVQSNTPALIAATRRATACWRSISKEPRRSRRCRGTTRASPNRTGSFSSRPCRTTTRSMPTVSGSNRVTSTF